MSTSAHPYLGWENGGRPFPEWGADGGSNRADFESRCRAVAHPTYVGDGIVMTKALGRFAMFLDANDTRIAHHLMFDGFWESWVTLGVASCLRPGMHVVDVGANHGYYSLLMADVVGPEGSVVAVEPQQLLVDLMARTFMANGLAGRIGVHRAAVADVSGTAELTVPLDFGANASLGKDFGMLEERIETVDVPCVTLDELLAERPVDFVKIDVEGAEGKVLAGMGRVITRNPAIQIGMEIEGWHAGHSELLGQLQAMGFRPFVINFSGELHEVPYSYLRERMFEPMVVFRRPVSAGA